MIQTRRPIREIPAIYFKQRKKPGSLEIQNAKMGNIYKTACNDENDGSNGASITIGSIKIISKNIDVLARTVFE